MSTITVTIPAAYNCKDAIEELAVIFEKHHENEDLLSMRLFRWGDDVSRTVRGKIGDGNEQFLAAAREKVGVLVREILVNPIDRAPLQKPVLERNWTWERWMHGDCYKLFPNSPFDQQQMQENPAGHQFAQEMLRWADKYARPLDRVVAIPMSYINRKQMQALVHFPGVQRPIYQRLIRSALSQEGSRGFREDIEAAMRWVDEQISAMKRKSEEALASVVESQAEHEKEIQNQIDSVDRIHQESVDGLNGRMAWIEQSHQENMAVLEKRIVSIDQANSAVAQSLKNQIESMSQEHKKAVTALGRQIDSIHEAHRSAVSCLESRMQSTISSMSQKHNAEVSVLATSLSASSASLDRTQERLRQTQAESKEHVNEIQRLKNSYATAQLQINGLRQEIDDMDDDAICSIM